MMQEGYSVFERPAVLLTTGVESRSIRVLKRDISINQSRVLYYFQINPQVRKGEIDYHCCPTALFSFVGAAWMGAVAEAKVMQSPVGK